MHVTIVAGIEDRDVQAALAAASALGCEIETRPGKQGELTFIRFPFDLPDGDRAMVEADMALQVSNALLDNGVVPANMAPDVFEGMREETASRFIVRLAGAPRFEENNLVNIPAKNRAGFEEKLELLRSIGTDKRLGPGPGLDGLNVYVRGIAANDPDVQHEPFIPEPGGSTDAPEGYRPR